LHARSTIRFMTQYTERTRPPKRATHVSVQSFQKTQFLVALNASWIPMQAVLYELEM